MDTMKREPSDLDQKWLSKLYRRSRSSRVQTFGKTTLVMFEKFCQNHYGRAHQEIVMKLKSEILQDRKNGKDDMRLYDFLDEYVQWLVEDYKPKHKEKLHSTTVKHYRNSFVDYVRTYGITVDSNMVNSLVIIPKTPEERKKPVELLMVREILNYEKSPVRIALYYVLLSSLMRIGEALALRKKDFDITTNPVTVNIRAEYTKTKQERETFITNEAKGRLLPVLKNLKDDDLVFTKSKTNERAVLTEDTHFIRLRKKAGMDKNRYESSGLNHFTLHGLRALGVTIVTERSSGEYAHAIGGHSQKNRMGDYLSTYYRLPDEVRRQKYREVEPFLMVSNEERLKADIVKQDKKIAQIEKLTRDVAESKVNVEALTQSVVRFMMERDFYRLYGEAEKDKHPQIDWERFYRELKSGKLLDKIESGKYSL